MAKGGYRQNISPPHNFLRLEKLLAARVCQSCRSVITLLSISGAGGSLEGTSGLKAEMDLYGCGTRMNEKRMMGQGPLVVEPSLLLQRADMLPNPSDVYVCPSQNKSQGF